MLSASEVVQRPLSWLVLSKNSKLVLYALIWLGLYPALNASSSDCNSIGAGSGFPSTELELNISFELMRIDSGIDSGDDDNDSGDDDNDAALPIILIKGDVARRRARFLIVECDYKKIKKFELI